MFRKVFDLIQKKIRYRQYIVTNHARKEMNCDVCGKNNAVTRRVTEVHGRGHTLLIVENIPMVSCPDCGEGYFTAEVLHEIERIKLYHKNFTTKKTVEIAEYV